MVKTRAQIKSEINQKGREKQSCINSRMNYEKALDYANKLVTSLNSSNREINSAKDYMKQYYTVNGKTPDDGELDSIKNTVTQYSKKVNNNIIPEINKNIKTLDARINKIEKEISALQKEYSNVEM